MEPLRLSDIGKPISLDKGWCEKHIKGRRNERKIPPTIIMTIRAPSGSVLAITDYHYKPTASTIERKVGQITVIKTCYYFSGNKRRVRAIREFMRRNRNGRTK